MKAKRICAILLTSILALEISGCDSNKEEKKPAFGIAENEIITLQPVSDQKTVITLRGQDNVNIRLMETELEKKFPNVDIVTTMNTPETFEIQSQDFADLYLTAAPKSIKSTEVEKNFIDLSMEDFISNYSLSALNDCEINGRIYYLPGPITITGIVYDKELFAENGWEIPNGLTEFIKLCKKINKTGIRGYQPALYYKDAVKLVFCGFNYSNAYAGAVNYSWLQGFKSGKTSMAGHMEEPLKRMKNLVKAGVIHLKDFNVRPIERTQMMYEEHSCAMIHETLNAPLYAKQYGHGKEHEIGMMPFWSGDGENDDYVFSEVNYYIAVNKRLEQKGNQKKLKVAMDILNYLSTPEGQSAVLPIGALEISPLNQNTIYDNEFLEHVISTIEKGNQVSLPHYSDTQISSVDTVFTQCLKEFLDNNISEQTLITSCDKTRDSMLNEEVENKLFPVGWAKKDFTILETTEYIADVFRRKAGAEIGLCCANTRINGCNAKFYKGEIQSFKEEIEGDGSILYYLNRGFQPNSKNKSQNGLMLVTMTGKQIEDALNEIYQPSELYPDAYMVASGLHIEFAPWAEEGKRVLEVTLQDGNELVKDELYTVAVWSGSVSPERITEVKKIYQEPFIDLLVSAIKEVGEIEPFRDNRFILNWDIRKE